LASDFVLAGFKSFQAVSDDLCKPFDIDRKGINLGEGVATIHLTTQPANMHTDLTIQLGMGASRNDANHISGPSRTGAELADALIHSIQGSGLQASDIGFVSAHGTATLYNDEMESKAFHLAGLGQIPLHSLKGNLGHTLGAAGLIESIIGMYALQNQTLLPTKGFENLGVPMSLQIHKAASPMQAKHFVKTTSGFGGCNAALVFSLY
jgi:3-oxoacyl-[acyl-carrier-protein] synthase-1